ncbi:phage tail sheath family protein [Streptomyces goshikiensis]|uniref:phage tail sheath family protein n=1 Tax=Streptomyces goshikiensis TaxID=1942 RepID=UPI0036B9CE20
MSSPIAPGVYIREIPSGMRLINGVGTSTPAFLAHYETPSTSGIPRVEYVRTWREFTGVFKPAGMFALQDDTYIGTDDAVPHPNSAALMVSGVEGAEKAALLKFTNVPSPSDVYKATLRVNAVAATAASSLIPALGPDEAAEWDSATAVWSAITGGVTGTDALDWTSGDATSVSTTADVVEFDVTTLLKGARGSSTLTILLKTTTETVGEDVTVSGSSSGAPAELVVEVIPGSLDPDSVINDVVYGYFANSGGPCYIVEANDLDDALTALKRLPDVKIVVYPDLWTTGLGTGNTASQLIAQHCADMGNRMALLHTPSDIAPEDDPLAGLAVGESAEPYTAVYYPWVKATGPDGATRLVPPSGHVAGVWGRVDAARGVHKAPANETLLGVTDLEYLLTDSEQAPLNEEGLNCLRAFPGQGIRVWGARTLDTVTADWKYLNVRRLINYLEESIRLGTNWAVFEPNDERLWSSIQRNVTSFLMDMYRDGSLFGATPDEAFYVVCDASNNPPEALAQGYVLCEVGVAAVRPAEFIFFEVMQIIGTPAQT